MIREEYVSFETSKSLKELGFNEPTRGIYRTNRGGDYNFVEYAIKQSLDNCIWDGFVYEYLAPTQALAARWLRETHGLSVEPWSDRMRGWLVNIASITDDDLSLSCGKVYETYEKAFEKGIQKALELIKDGYKAD